MSFLDDLLLERKEPPLLDVLNQYWGQPHVFVSFRDLPKFGLNPDNHYNTPTGIYGYPLNWMIHEQGRVPFASDRRYAWIFKWNGKGRLLTNAYNNIAGDTRYLEKLYLSIVEPLLGKKIAPIDDIIVQGENEARYGTPLGQLWNITRLTALAIAEATNRKSPNTWSWLFVKLGISGVHDDGIGVVHSNEPFQGVFFDPSSVTALRRYDNVDVGNSYNQHVVQTKSRVAALQLSPEEQEKLAEFHPERIMWVRNPTNRAIQIAITTLFQQNGSEISPDKTPLINWALQKNPRFAKQVIRGLCWRPYWQEGVFTHIASNARLRPYLEQRDIDRAFQAWYPNIYYGEETNRFVKDLSTTGIDPHLEEVALMIRQKRRFELIKYYPGVIEYQYFGAKRENLEELVQTDPAAARFAIMVDYPIEKITPPTLYAAIMGSRGGTRSDKGRKYNMRPLTEEDLAILLAKTHHYCARPEVQAEFVLRDNVFSNEPKYSVPEAFSLLGAVGIEKLIPEIQGKIIQDARKVIDLPVDQMFELHSGVMLRLLLSNGMLDPAMEVQRNQLTQQLISKHKTAINPPDEP